MGTQQEVHYTNGTHETGNNTVVEAKEGRVKESERVRLASRERKKPLLGMKC